jgi:hypothetical protein
VQTSPGVCWDSSQGVLGVLAKQRGVEERERDSRPKSTRLSIFRQLSTPFWVAMPSSRSTVALIRYYRRTMRQNDEKAVFDNADFLSHGRESSVLLVCEQRGKLDTKRRASRGCKVGCNTTTGHGRERKRQCESEGDSRPAVWKGRTSVESTREERGAGKRTWERRRKRSLVFFEFERRRHRRPCRRTGQWLRSDEEGLTHLKRMGKSEKTSASLTRRREEATREGSSVSRLAQGRR